MFGPKTHFDDRLKSLKRRDRAMDRGYTMRMRSDGLIVREPVRRRIEIPVKGMVLLVVGFFCFKAFILATIGPAVYDERVAKLGDGTIVEQGGAWVMQADPLTHLISDQLGPVFRTIEVLVDAATP